MVFLDSGSEIPVEILTTLVNDSLVLKYDDIFIKCYITSHITQLGDTHQVVVYIWDAISNGCLLQEVV